MTCEPCTRVVAAFDVNTRPIPKARARSGQGRHYTPKRTRDYEALIATAARAAMNGREPVAGPVILYAAFEQTDRRRADKDNLTKAIQDAMNGVVYVDDSQIVEGHDVIIRGADVNRVNIAVLTKETP